MSIDFKKCESQVGERMRDNLLEMRTQIQIMSEAEGFSYV